MSSAVPHAPRSGLFQVIDWRFVAAVGLPLWAFLLGVVVAHKSAPPVLAAAELTETAAIPPSPGTPAPIEASPAPREVLVRTEFLPVPLTVPIPNSGPVSGPPVAAASAELAAPVEFKLPPSEVMPADRCKTFDTKIRFHPDLASAAEEAKISKKMLLVLHISGNFEDPGFT